MPSFISITHGLPERARRCAVFIAATMLADSALIGDWLLRTLAISFRIARGLLLFSIASEMVFGLRIERQSRQAEEVLRGARAQHCRLPACHPADGWPRRDHGDGLARGPRQRCARQDCNPSAVIAIVLVLCFVVSALAARIAGFIGATGNVVLSRLLGVILAALAVQYIVDGVRAAISG